MLLVLGGCFSAYPQVQFQLDTTFRTEILSQNVNSVLTLSNGKVMISGRFRFPGDMNDTYLDRLLENGERDDSYSSVLNSGLGGGKITPWQEDRFYVAGGLLIRRITLPDGANDPSWQVGNSVIPFFLPIQPGDYHVFPDGRILLSGTHELDDEARGFVGNYDLIWFSNTGYLDTTRTHRRGNGQVGRFQPLPNDQFIGSCTCTEMEGVPVGRIFRFNADGSTDPTFQSGVFIGAAYGYLPLADGRCYVGGNFQRTAAPEDTLRLVRFLVDGSLDPSFTIPHFTTSIPNPFGPVIGNLYPMPNGRLIAVGFFEEVNGLPRRGICMLDSTGQVTDAFDDCGVGPFETDILTYASISRISMDTINDHMYLSGAYNGYDDGTTNDTLQRFVSRLLVEDLPTNTATNERHALRVFPNPATTSTTLELAQLPASAKLTVRDALGRALWHQTVHAYNTTLDLQTLSDGLYILELRSNEQRLAVQRLVVQH